MKQYHLAIEDGEAGSYAILTGDPGRCPLIAGYFEDSSLTAKNREYVTYSGFLEGARVSVVSTGIGGPSSAIAMEELYASGVHTFIRVGSCGGINLKVKGGDLVIASAAVRAEGTTHEYAPIEFPACSDFYVLSALQEAALELPFDYHIGIIHSKDSFYGQHSPLRMPVFHRLLDKWEAWKRLGVLASEMETAALFVVAASLGVRCGACFSVLWNKDRQSADLPDVQSSPNATAAIKLGVEALKKIIIKDKLTNL